MTESKVDDRVIGCAIFGLLNYLRHLIALLNATVKNYIFGANHNRTAVLNCG